MLTRRLLLASLMGGAAAQSGTAIVMRLKDRRILHLEDEGFANGAVLPPASTVKPFALFGLMDAGKLRGDDLFACSHRLTIRGHELNCVHPVVPTPMNAARAIAYSCNGAVAHFALRFGVGELGSDLVRFGFGGVGRVKRATVGETAQLQALGEEGVSVTPRELLLAYARLVGQLRSGPILEGLEGAVEYGTAQAAHLEGVRVAGKTGSILLRSGSPAAWFAGFAPSRDPKVLVVVLRAGRSGGADAAPVGGELLKRYL